MKHLFVINPHSFRKPESLKQIIADIEGSFPAGFGMNDRTDYKIHISRYPRDAIPAVHRYISNCPDGEIVRVYAVGGDGILFDCLNGMVDFPNAELTSVPYGNNNDFILAFGENINGHITDRFRDLTTLSTAPSRPVDIINFGSNYAMLEVNIGLIGQTLIYKNDVFSKIPEKILRGNAGLAYSFCAILALFNRELLNQHYSILLDGEDLSGSYYHIKIANCACNAGAFIPNPYARPDNGSFELVLSRTTSKTNIIRTMKDYNSGRSEKYDFFVHKRGRKLEVKSDKAMSVMIDDEAFYTDQIKLELIPGGIKFFAPEGLDIVDYSYMAYKNAAGKGGKNP